MTIVQKLINRELDNLNIKKVFDKCMQIDEIKQYLSNLDDIAQVHNMSHISNKEQEYIDSLASMQYRLRGIIKLKIQKILNDAGCGNNLEYVVEQITDIMADDVDFSDSDLDMSKLYIVSKFIKEIYIKDALMRSNSIQAQEI